MELAPQTDITSHANYERLLKPTSLLQPGILCCMKETKNKAKKKLLQAHIILKLKKKIMNPYTTPFHGFSSKKVITTPVVIPTTPVIATSYPYQQDYGCPLAVNDWHPMNTPLFTIQPLPIIVPSPSTIFTTHICPFGGNVVPVIAPIVPQTCIQDITDVSNYVSNFCEEKINDLTKVPDEETYNIQEKGTSELEQATLINNEIKTINVGNLKAESDPLEVYLTLPKELFPTARMLSFDPNPIIDEFCKMPNLQRHAPWILDLEFGIPRTLITRPLPIYNVKFNSIHCKNTPDAIHPGFESCTPDFKRAVLFYYDCVVSAWYRGYIMVTCDRSVENFQSWLLLPMKVLGMCWP